MCVNVAVKTSLSMYWSECASQLCSQQSGGVPESSSKVVLRGGLYVVFGSALLAGLGNVGFEPVCSGVLSVFRVVSGLPLLSALWGWSGVCAEVVGGAVVLRGLPLQLEEVLQESAASVGVVGCGW